MPAEKREGSHVLAASVVRAGALRIQARLSSPSSSSSPSRYGDIQKLAAAAAATQHDEEQEGSRTVADRFAGWYFPLILGAAVVLAVVPEAENALRHGACVRLASWVVGRGVGACDPLIDRLLHTPESTRHTLVWGDSTITTYPPKQQQPHYKLYDHPPNPALPPPPPIQKPHTGTPFNPRAALRHALELLCLASPMALAMAAPLTYLAALTASVAQGGVVVKTPRALERLGRLQVRALVVA